MESSRVREPRRTALPRGSWLAVSGFMVMGLVSGLSLANHSDSESCLVAQPCSAKMDARDKDSGRGSDMCLFLTFAGFFQLVVAY